MVRIFHSRAGFVPLFLSRIVVFKQSRKTNATSHGSVGKVLVFGHVVTRVRTHWQTFSEICFVQVSSLNFSMFSILLFISLVA